MAKKKNKPCDQCVALMINGVYCHEIGCPNMSITRVRRVRGKARRRLWAVR